MKAKIILKVLKELNEEIQYKSDNRGKLLEFCSIGDNDISSVEFMGVYLWSTLFGGDMDKETFKTYIKDQYNDLIDRLQKQRLD